MVAKIKSGKSLIGAINYNEHKVKHGKAKLIAAQSYAKDVDRLSFDDKLFRLKDLAARNIRTRTNTVHLSLNFDVSESLSEDKLIDVADAYMLEIGFGNQPYLVYQHFDAGHPHVHIVTTNIDTDGSRISLHNIGKLLSEPARKKVELEFGLVQADSKKNVESLERSQINALDYGSTDIKRAMTNIVNEVVKNYQFTSLPEFNAVLNLFNISADRGAKETVMYEKGGLRYWALDERGNKLGVPIKASSIYKKPTLKLLEDRFRLGEYLRKPFRENVKSKIDQALQGSGNREKFIAELKRSEITGIFRQNAEGRIYGVTYIDNRHKVVFNGSDLGKNYSAAAVVDSFQNTPTGGNASAQNTDQATQYASDINSVPGNNISKSLLEELLEPTHQGGSENLFERKKKKKRKKLNL